MHVAGVHSMTMLLMTHVCTFSVTIISFTGHEVLTHIASRKTYRFQFVCYCISSPVSRIMLKVRGRIFTKHDVPVGNGKARVNHT